MSSECFLFTTWYFPIRKSHSLFLSIKIAQSDNRHRNREYQPIIESRLIGDLQTADQAAKVCKTNYHKHNRCAHYTILCKVSVQCQGIRTRFFLRWRERRIRPPTRNLSMCWNMHKVDDCDDKTTPTARRHSSTLYNIEYKHAHWTQLLTVKVACCGDAHKLCG